MAITGPVGVRLSLLAGVDIEDVALRGNLVDYWPGPSLTGKGDHFPREEAEMGWMKLVPFLRGKRTIVLGRTAAKVIGLGNEPWMNWREVHPEYFIAVLPHPSGIVRWWNDPINADAAAEFMRGAFDE